MEFEDQEEQEEEMGLPASYDSLGNSSRVQMMTSEPATEAHPLRKARYRECLKNHAVGIAGHAVDGCCEFMPAGEEGTLDALKCAACNCHRNFHRKEIESSAPPVAGPVAGAEFYFQHHHPTQVPQFPPYYRTPAGYLHVAPHHRPLALPSTSGGGTHSREDQEDVSNLGGGSRKRFRTKFTQEQKDKMLELAEKLGWRIQKHDEEVVQQFCNETGVKRHVLKVWMHNNKHTLENASANSGICSHANPNPDVGKSMFEKVNRSKAVSGKLNPNTSAKAANLNCGPFGNLGQRFAPSPSDSD